MQRYSVTCSEDLEPNWTERREYKVQTKVLQKYLYELENKSRNMLMAHPFPKSTFKENYEPYWVKAVGGKKIWGEQTMLNEKTNRPSL